MSIHMHGPDVELEALPTAPVYELVTFGPSFQEDLPAHWPKGPGEGCRGADGSAAILKIATDRWLLLHPRNDVVATAAALSRVCALTDVTGKWRKFRLMGTSATRLLANSVNVDELLCDRDCARTALFDCPALLYKLNGGFSVWIERSYESAFVIAIEHAIKAPGGSI
jgi:sarcosine oxidase gamma subunit